MSTIRVTLIVDVELDVDSFPPPQSSGGVVFPWEPSDAIDVSNPVVGILEGFSGTVHSVETVEQFTEDIS